MERAPADIDVTEASSLDALLEGPGFYQDPYPAFRRLRAESPVHWHAASRTWLIARYDDVERAFKSPREFSSYGFQNAYFKSLRPELAKAAPTLEQRGREPTLITSDPPAHTRLRRHLQVGFTPRVIDGLRPKIAGIVRELLAERAAPDTLEVVSELAFPLPAIMIAEILGVPREDRELFKSVSGELVLFMNRANPNEELTVSFAEHADRMLRDFREYLGDLIESRTREPGTTS